VRQGDAERATHVMSEHVKGTEHILAGLLPQV
jgi:DNA-binding GntR family transcriptional regulator